MSLKRLSSSGSATRMLIVIILLATALRVFHLGSQSIWHDEAISLGIADRLSFDQIVSNAARSSHPPFYYLVLRAWVRAAGVSDFTARIPSAFAGVLLVPVIFQAGRRLYGRRLGLGAAILTAILPFQITYAQEARMYTWLALFTGLSIYLFHSVLSQGTPRRWLMMGIVWALGLYTHYFFLFVILSFHLFAIVPRSRNRGLCKALLLVDLAVWLAFLPQASILLQESRTALGQCYWLDKPSPLAGLTAIYFYLVSYTVPQTLNVAGLFVALGWLAVGTYELVSRSRQESCTRDALTMLVLGALSPLVFVLAISQVRPIFLERTLIICTPFLILLLALSLVDRPRLSPTPVLAGGLGILLIMSLYHYYFDPAMYKPALRQVVVKVDTVRRSGEVLVHTSIGSYLPFLFYTEPEDNYLLWGGEQTDPCKPPSTYELFGGKVVTQNSLNTPERIWLVMMPDRNIAYQQSQMKWFDEHWAFEAEISAEGVLLRLYAPRLSRSARESLVERTVLPGIHRGTPLISSGRLVIEHG